MFKSNYFKIFMRLNKVSFGMNLNLFGIPVIFKKKGSVLKIGDNCNIKSSFLSNLIGLSQRTIIVTRTSEAKIEIGNNVGISGATIYARKGIYIGDNTLIGGNVKILDNDFHPIEAEARNRDDKDMIKSKEIVIGRNCFIGCNSIIIKGSKIGVGSVVGAGSVVSGQFPSRVVIGGNPARIIKSILRKDTMLDLTVVILTKNENNNLRKCIESFNGIVKRFVIVDSYSTDGTKVLCEELSKTLNISFYENKFIDYATQLNWGLSNTGIATKWSMRMDADEELTPELVDEIKKKLPSMEENIKGIVLKRRVYFMGRWIKHGGKYPELLLRIFKTGLGVCEQKLMDEHMILLDGDTIKFKHDLIDNNNKDLEWWTHKHNWYSNREVLDYQQKVLNENNVDKLVNDNLNKGQAARKRFVKNNGYYKLPLFVRAHIYFIYRYYFRFGFLDGTEGKIYHFLQAYWYRFLVDAKIYECEKFGKKMKSQGDLK